MNAKSNFQFSNLKSLKTTVPLETSQSINFNLEPVNLLVDISNQSAIKTFIHKFQEPFREFSAENTKMLYKSYYQKHSAIREALYNDLSTTINLPLFSSEKIVLIF